MLKNYFKTAIRSLVKRKSFTAINVVGLAVGIATCLVIFLYVQNEWSFDRYNANADRLVRVEFRGTMEGSPLKESNVMPPTAQALKADYPEVVDAARMRFAGKPLVTSNNMTFNEDGFAYVDPNFFNLFSFKFLAGSAASSLTQPNTVVISKSMAIKYFGKETALGKLLQLKSWNQQYTVTGVVEDMPENAHFHAGMFASMENIAEAKEQNWMTSSYFTYLLLPENYDYKKLEAKLPQFIENHMGAQFEKAFGMPLAQYRKKGNDLGFKLQPVTGIHLYADNTNELEAGGDIRYVYIFSAIALFMLLIACINFMNLSTAGASKRAREIAVKKVLGSSQKELVRQFLTESVLLALVALLLAIFMVYLALPLFNNLSGRHLSVGFFANAKVIIGLVVACIAVGMLAGSYPAFFLAAFKPVAVLKGKFAAGRQSISLRSSLVVFQFFVSIVLIVSTAVVQQQLAYIQNKKLGYDKEQVMVLPDTWMLGKNVTAFRNQLMQNPGVANVSVSGYIPAGDSYNNNFFVYADNNSSKLIKALRYDVDENYIPTMGMQLKAGRNFSKQFGTDSTGIVINETAAATLGWGDNALCHFITNPQNGGDKNVYQVIGIVKDFNFRSLHEKISPLGMVLDNNAGTTIVKIKTSDVAGMITAMKNDWTKFGVDAPFTYSFLDDRFNNMYNTEKKTATLLSIFAGLTIFVACMGLFALATFTAEQRTREVGIRKVLGASLAGIFSLLSKDFLKLVGIALLIAAPVAWYIMSRWLQDFAYRINITAWVFVLAGIIAMLIAVGTISFQVVKAAVINPVKSLKAD